MSLATFLCTKFFLFSIYFPSCEHANTNACEWSPGLFVLVCMSRFHDGPEE